MRSPPRPDTQEFKASETPPGSAKTKREPSYPDRQRIDSDVRAFMRPVSTPWIVFDRDSKIEEPYSHAAMAALRAGVGRMSSPDLPPTNPAVPVALAHVAASAASRLAETNAMFPASVPGLHATPTDIEPSSLIVAKDVVDDTSARPAYVVATKRGGLKLAIAAAAIMGIAAGGTLAFTRSVDASAPAAAAVQAPPPAQVIVAQPIPEPEAAPAATAAAAPSEPAEVVGEFATDAKKRWGTLTIRPDAKTKNVWLDGKRMLGTGKRSFMVYCGVHTIAVNEKADQKDMEVPCNGELTIGK